MSCIPKEYLPFTARFTTNDGIVRNNQNTNRFRTHGFWTDRLIHFGDIFLNPILSIVVLPIFGLTEYFKNKETDFHFIVKFFMFSILTSPLVLISNIFGVFFPNNANNIMARFKDNTSLSCAFMDDLFFEVKRPIEP